MQSTSNRRLAYSVAEASFLTGLGKTKLYQLIGSGALKSRKIGRRRLIPADELERMVVLAE